MVEGHSVHRVARAHSKRLVGRYFRATSPNGRFVKGAELINGRKMTKVEAVGKNLFAFFGGESVDQQPATIVHVHFGMSGRWAVFDRNKAPDPTPTTRLRLEDNNIISHLSAMTVDHGTIDLYNEKRMKLGQDGLRDDADPHLLWERVSKARKSIGKLLMDQAYFAGVGNIFRAEILFKSGIHPEILGNELSRGEFGRIWHHTVHLLRRAFHKGSILTVDPEEANLGIALCAYGVSRTTQASLGKPGMRRYIYNQRKCGRCGGNVRSWQMAARTCYACPKCQPMKRDSSAKVPSYDEVRVFQSHCARESLGERLRQPEKLKVSELREELRRRGLPVSGKKATLVSRLRSSKWQCPSCSFMNIHSALVCIMCAEAAATGILSGSSSKGNSMLTGVGPSNGVGFAKPGIQGIGLIRSAAAASSDKKKVGEKLNVEHVADLDLTLQGQTVDWTDLEGDRKPKSARSRRKSLPISANGKTPKKSTRKRRRYSRKRE